MFWFQKRLLKPPLYVGAGTLGSIFVDALKLLMLLVIFLEIVWAMNQKFLKYFDSISYRINNMQNVSYYNSKRLKS